MSHHISRGPLLLLLAGAALPATLPAQRRSTDLTTAARAQLPAHPDSAEVLLRAALVVAPYPNDSAIALLWLGITYFYSGNDSLARASFRAATKTDAGTQLRNLEQVSPRLAELYESERMADMVFDATRVDVPPSHVGGPPVEYPRDAWRRGIRGRAVVEAILDTAGHVEPTSIRIVQVPDSALAEPVRRSLLAATYTPGRQHGRAVRTILRLGIELQPGPAPNVTDLVGRARSQLARQHADSALGLLEFALDTAVHATPGEGVYARLVLGMALAASGRDSLAATTYDAALAGYRDLAARHVDLAPFLRRLADSIGLARRSGRRAVTTVARLVVLGQVDEPPALLSSPPIRYPPEMWQLKIGGTVIVEATVDASGRVAAGSVKIVQSPNHGLDAEAIRLVRESSYRPARRGGQPVQAVIRQPVTFEPH